MSLLQEREEVGHGNKFTQLLLEYRAKKALKMNKSLVAALILLLHSWFASIKSQESLLSDDILHEDPLKYRLQDAFIHKSNN